MPPPSSIVLGLIGILTTINGLSGLLFSSLTTKNAEILGIDSPPAMHAIALGAVSIGTIYIIAALRNDTTTMKLTVVGRAFAVAIFWNDGGAWRNVAIYEGVCGVLVAAALVWEHFQPRTVNKKFV